VTELEQLQAENAALKRKLATAQEYITLYQAERPRPSHTEIHQIELEVWENMIQRMKAVRKESGV
jgi:protein-tyrosine phosphatase